MATGEDATKVYRDSTVMKLNYFIQVLDLSVIDPLARIYWAIAWNHKLVTDSNIQLAS